MRRWLARRLRRWAERLVPTKAEPDVRIPARFVGGPADGKKFEVSVRYGVPLKVVAPALSGTSVAWEEEAGNIHGRLPPLAVKEYRLESVEAVYRFAEADAEKVNTALQSFGFSMTRPFGT